MRRNVELETWASRQPLPQGWMQQVCDALTGLQAPGLTRPSRLRRKFVELLMCTGLQLIIVEQYIQPTIANGLTPWRELQWPKLIERVLKLSLPTVYGWLIMFYSIFHLLLNIIAEITGFEDREFYKVGPMGACLIPLHAFGLAPPATG